MHNNNQKNKLLTTVYLLPTVVILLVFMIIPIIYTFYLSFFDWNLIAPNKNFVGLENYITIFTDAVNRKVLMNTFFYIILLLILNFIVPYFIAIIVQFFIGKMKGPYKVIFFIPSIFSLVVGAMLFSWIMNPVSGPLADVMKMIGLSIPNWTNSGGMAIVIVCLITNWKVFGYNFVLLLTGLGAIPKNLIDAAKIDRIPKWRVIWNIVLPLNKSIALYVLILTIVQGLQYVFTPISVITQGGPYYGSSNILYHTYLNAFVLYKTGNASALAILTFMVFLVLLYIEMRFVEGKSKKYA
ncbi:MULTISPECIES: carbohydrate ABC transporter permease [Leuconostoc]|uniref:Sugar ABC transporter permease n=1 Tax=Leuconostoc pseudomesenteroides TaxID=33968 RepID=A0A5B8T5P8_LEUPS|nr:MULTISPECIES: sugar ABC transporter permease [Leuconostoc]MCC8439598.1 ABC transporter permease [Leuconostoc pseudomesenteroides]MDN2451369.1 sugar ABC transporter permease [Leuconostoc sp. UCMA20149]NKZ35917.1 sugar ABC transporter permease [Leuconostoc pseudomesenteroides]QEA42458.1 sugar ABC transporter permease [Leuconostoc pseudomesenteroides]